MTTFSDGAGAHVCIRQLLVEYQTMVSNFGCLESAGVHLSGQGIVAISRSGYPDDFWTEGVVGSIDGIRTRETSQSSST